MASRRYHTEAEYLSAEHVSKPETTLPISLLCALGLLVHIFNWIDYSFDV